MSWGDGASAGYERRARVRLVKMVRKGFPGRGDSSEQRQRREEAC